MGRLAKRWSLRRLAEFDVLSLGPYRRLSQACSPGVASSDYGANERSFNMVQYQYLVR